MNERGVREKSGQPTAAEDVVPTPAESWQRHVRIFETLEKIRETRRRRREPDLPRTGR